jgi:hypothetical protein
VTIPYNQAQHERNWADLLDMVGEIESQLVAQEKWLLTGDLAQCEHCAYTVYCGRLVVVQDPSSWQEENMAIQLEPELP